MTFVMKLAGIDLRRFVALCISFFWACVVSSLVHDLNWPKITGSLVQWNTDDWIFYRNFPSS